MLTRKNLGLLLIPVLILTQCSTWYKLTRKESDYYTPAELKILIDVTDAADFRYGFDPDLELDYIYMAGKFSSSELASKETKMKDTLSKYSRDELINFYEKIYRLTEILAWNIKDYKADEDWAEATLIEKYLLPDTLKFHEMLEKNVIRIDEKYRSIINQRKKVIREQVIRELD